MPKHRLHLPGLLVVCLILSSCAGPQMRAPTVDSVAAELEAKKQRELVLEAFLERQGRLDRIGYPILQAAVPLCEGKRRYTTGAWFWTKNVFPDELREAAVSRYGATDLVEVGMVRSGSPAERSGLLARDIPVRVNGWEVPTGADAFDQFVAHLDKILQDPAPIVISVRRGSAPLDVTIIPDQICDYRLIVERNDAKNAYADGERIVVFQGMMDFLHTDEELATVVAHEAAHNVMGHVKAKQTNAAVGGVFGLVLDLAAAAAGVNTQGEFTRLGAQVGASTYSVEFEQEADYVGLYLMAKAGFDESKAPHLWRRMAVQNPKAIELRTTHPTTPVRFVGLEQGVAEIAHKRSARLPLEPELKPKDVAPSPSTPSDVGSDR